VTIPALDLSTASDEAARAAEVAGVEIRHPDTTEELVAAGQLLTDVWGSRADDPPVQADILRALVHIDSYVAAAYRGDRVVGVGVAFFAAPQQHSLHSHIVGIDPRVQTRGIGFALKLEQRAWALERGVRHISWTFDPLVARNAYFNVAKLGARITAYHPDFYGQMSDGLNSGQGSDRLFVEWDIAERLPDPAGPSSALSPDVRVSLQPDATGAPVRLPADGPVLACRIPTDIAALRATSPALAAVWREEVRSVLGGAMSAGYQVTGFTRAAEYVLEPPSQASLHRPTQ
jgi:predicted GNAT superfamily acetyltransferase